MTTDHGKVGSFLHVFGLMMASVSKEYYQFLLSQAVCSSIGTSTVFYPAFSATVSWFFEKRAMAVGIAAAGSRSHILHGYARCTLPVVLPVF